MRSLSSRTVAAATSPLWLRAIMPRGFAAPQDAGPHHQRYGAGQASATGPIRGHAARAGGRGASELDAQADRQVALADAGSADQVLVVHEAGLATWEQRREADADVEVVGVERVAGDGDRRLGGIVQEAHHDRLRVVLELVLPLEVDVRHQDAPVAAGGIG